MDAHDPSAPSKEDRVLAAIADYVDAESSGSSIDEEEFLAQHADLQEELREFLADQKMFAGAAALLHPIGAGGSGLQPTRLMDLGDDKDPAGPETGKTLRYFGDYLLLGEIARGGMGVIYKARQTSLDREVAIKLILAGQLASKTLVERFNAEAKAVAQLQHPNFVRIYEVGQHDDQHYFAMEYVNGPSLADRIRKQPLPINQAVEYLRRLALAIDYAHHRGVVHRDIKPSNILIDDDGEPKITDFGLAKDASSDERNLTATGEVIGTPSYMPPEQVIGKVEAIGPRSDIYSLGAVLYELLTGRPPFLAASAVETILQVQKQEVISPRVLNQAVSRDLETICLKCLEKEPRKRYQTASELAEDLHRYQTGQPIVARPIGWPERTTRWCRRNPAYTALAAVMLMAFVGTSVQWARAEYYHAQSTFANSRLRKEKRLSDRRAIEARQAQKELSKLAQKAFGHAEVAERAEQRSRRSLYIANVNLAMQAIEKGDYRRAAQLIGTDNRRTESLDRDLYSFDWYYLWRRLHQQSQRYLNHGGDVRHATLISDGKVLVTSGLHREVKAWEVASGKLLWTLLADDRWVTCTATHGDHLLTFGSNGLRVWDSDDRTLIREHPLKVADSRKSVFSHGADRLAMATHSFAVVLVDTSSGEVSRRLEGHTAALTALAFSQDNQTLATASYDRTVRLWDVASGQLQKTLKFPNRKRVYSLVFSADGSTLVCGTNHDGGGIDLWDTDQGELIGEYSGHDNYVDAVVFSKDQQTLISGSRDQTIAFWDVDSGEVKHRLRGHSDHVKAVGFLPNQTQVFSASNDGTARIWAIPDTDENDPDVIPIGKPVTSVCWSPDGQTLASGNHGWGISIHDRRGNLARELKGHKGLVYEVEFSPDGSLLASCSSDKTIRLWDTQSWKTVAVITDLDTAARSVAFSSDSKWLAAGDHQATITIWEVASRQLVRSATFPDEHGQRRMIYDIAFSADGSHVAATGDFLILMSALKEEDEIVRPQSFAGYAVEYSPTGRLLASTAGIESVYIDDRDRDHVTRFRAHTNSVNDLLFTPDEKTLITCSSDRLIKIWDVKSRRQRLALSGHQEPVTTLAMTADGKTLASGSRDGTIRLWHASTEQDVLAFAPATPPGDDSQMVKLHAVLSDVEQLGGRMFMETPSQRFSAISNVYLEGEQVSDETLQTLATQPRLQVLSLRDTKVTGTGLQHLSSCRELRELVLLGDHVSGDALAHLANFPQLRSLQLGRGLQPELEELDTRAASVSLIDDKAMKHLARLDSLSYLALDNTAVTRAGLELLRDLEHLKGIQIVRTTTINQEDVDALRTQMPETEITLDEPLTPWNRQP